jgi:hypothetical protein
MFLASYTPNLMDLFLLLSDPAKAGMLLGLGIILTIIAFYGIIWLIWYFTKS